MVSTEHASYSRICLAGGSAHENVDFDAGMLSNIVQCIFEGWG